MNKILAAAASLAALCCISLPSASLAAWPERPVKLVLSSGAGTSVDVVGRLIAQKLSEAVGQPVVPQNTPGGGLGGFAMTLKNAKADGYTIGLGNDVYFTFGSLDPKAQFSMDDFTFVCSIFQGDSAYIVSPDKPWKNLAEILEASKSSPKPLNYLFHTAQDRKIMEEYVRNTGAKVNFVPQPSPAALVTAIIGGHGDFGFAGGVQYEQERAGKVRSVTIALDRRSPHFPDTPAVNEVMTPAYPIPSYRLIIVPKGFPEEALARLREELKKIITSDEFRAIVDGRLHYFVSYMDGDVLMRNLGEQLESNRKFWK